MRNSARKQLQNHSLKSKLKTLVKNYEEQVSAGKKDDATRGFRTVSSALDKAAKSGVIPVATARRKKSRLAVRLAALK